MTRRVLYAPSAERHLKDLYDWIAAASSADTADRYVMAIMDRCDQLADFPMVGAAREDIRPGLRTLGYRRRAVIAFAVTDTTVEIVGVHYGGRESTGSLRPTTHRHRPMIDHGRYWSAVIDPRNPVGEIPIGRDRPAQSSGRDSYGRSLLHPKPPTRPDRSTPVDHSSPP